VSFPRGVFGQEQYADNNYVDQYNNHVDDVNHDDDHNDDHDSCGSGNFITR
jgi:hypothetical protein